MAKPTTKFVRHKVDEENVRDMLISYHNLMELCELFDQGKRWVSNLIAVEIAKLVANEGRDQSPILLRSPRAELEFSSTPELFSLPPGSVIAGKYNLLVVEVVRQMEAPEGITMVRSSWPRCWDYARNEKWIAWKAVSYEEWWDRMIVMSEAHTTGTPYRYTRRGLIKTIRDAQGAHSRGALREDELPLNAPNAFSFAVGHSSPLQPCQEVRHAVEILPSQAAVRQIGEELLHSMNANNCAGLFD